MVLVLPILILIYLILMFAWQSMYLYGNVKTKPEIIIIRHDQL